MKRTAAVVALLASLPFHPDAGTAQELPALEYAAKIVCGSPNYPAVAPGTYHTAINVHNPGTRSVEFRVKVALTRPGMEPGTISGFTSLALRPDQAMEIDCTDVRKLSEQSLRLYKGFVVIQSDHELDVVGVYTAAGRARTVETMDIERVPARRHREMESPQPQCPDLVVDTILRPEWDAANNRSVIRARIRNAGGAPAPMSIARVVDPSTTQSTGAPYNAIANTPALAPGASADVVFHLPYWVYNPDAHLEVTADYKGMVAECREDNNTKTFQERG